MSIDNTYLNGITIDFWLYFYNRTSISSDVLYEISIDDKMILRINPFIINVDFKLNSNIFNVNYKYTGWENIKIKFDFKSYIAINSNLTKIVNNTNFPQFSNYSQINFNNKLLLINQNIGLYLKEFKIWKIIVPHSFNISNQ